jgi:hypothetical protein
VTVTSEAGWRADGSPWHPAPCIAAFAALLRSYTFTVYELGDERHLSASPPEDHTPYSHTPWPMGQPYPYVLACDIMPGGPVDWRYLGERIVADRDAGRPGTEWIKYVNWTNPVTGAVHHTSWEPGRKDTSSTDSGHIHISARSDRYTQTDLKGWNPVAELLGGAPSKPTTPPTTAPDWTAALVTTLPTLARNDKAPANKNVRKLQGLLDAQGYDVKGIDGIFGANTETALQRFQVAYKVPNSVTSAGQGDGRCGQQTWTYLLTH